MKGAFTARLVHSITFKDKEGKAVSCFINPVCNNRIQMKRIMVYLIALTSLSCGHQTASTPLRYVDSSILSDKTNPKINSNLYSQRTMYAFDGTYLARPDSLKEYVARTFKADLEGINESDVREITFDQNADIETLGLTSIYSIKFSNDLAEVSPKSGYLIYSVAKRQATILFLRQLKLLKLKTWDSTQLISGEYDVRSKGYLLIYRFKNNEFSAIFNSRDCGECDAGVAISNSSTECISYQPSRLTFVNQDSDGDGLNDLVYTGKVNFYCDRLEVNVGRLDRAPRRSMAIRIVFKQIRHYDSVSWKLSDTACCRTINNKYNGF